MTDKPIRIPNADHPITIAPEPTHVVVRAGETVIADTQAALELREANYPPVLYIPRGDVVADQFGPSDHHSYCPYKGEASYHHLPALGERGTDAVWVYETPHPAVAAIAGHLAFYADRVTISREG